MLSRLLVAVAMLAACSDNPSPDADDAGPPAPPPPPCTTGYIDPEAQEFTYEGLDVPRLDLAPLGMLACSEVRHTILGDTQVSHEYDASGRRTFSRFTRDQSVQTVRYLYTDSGELTATEVLSGAATVARVDYGYDDDCRLVTRASDDDADGVVDEEVTYVHEDGRLSEAHVEGQDRFYAYDDAGRLLRIVHDPEVENPPYDYIHREHLRYDEAGELFRIDIEWGDAPIDRGWLVSHGDSPDEPSVSYDLSLYDDPRDNPIRTSYVKDGRGRILRRYRDGASQDSLVLDYSCRPPEPQASGR